MTFEFFDRASEVVIREGKLPHWHQPGVTYFVTFRTEDIEKQCKSWKYFTAREINMALARRVSVPIIALTVGM